MKYVFLEIIVVPCSAYKRRFFHALICRLTARIGSFTGKRVVHAGFAASLIQKPWPLVPLCVARRRPIRLFFFLTCRPQNVRGGDVFISSEII